MSKEKQSSCTSDWNELVLPSSGTEMVGSSTEKTLFVDHTHKTHAGSEGKMI
jgi:hypothetical protein